MNRLFLCLGIAYTAYLCATHSDPFWIAVNVFLDMTGVVFLIQNPKKW
jgi:hypothetical protein